MILPSDRAAYGYDVNDPQCKLLHSPSEIMLRVIQN